MARSRLVALLLIAATISVYARTASYPFISYDDDLYVTGNLQVRAGLSLEGARWALTTGHAANWHPLTWLSHMLDCQLYGLWAGGHHLTNVALHTLNALLLFGLLRSLTGSVGRSGLVAALFALHPLHVESVAWVAERKDLLSATFGLLAIWCYAHYARRGGAGRYMLVFAMLALALLAKPMLVTLPLLLLLLDYWPLGRLASGPSGGAGRAWMRLGLEKVPLLMLSAASSVITVLVQQRGGAVASVMVVPMGDRLGNALVAYVRYISKTLVPTDLAVFYPHPVLPGGQAWAWWQVAGAGLLLVAITGALAFACRRRYAAVGWLWFTGMLVPVLGLVQVGGQAMADRYTYLPVIGLFVVGVWGGAECLAALRKRVPGRLPGAAVLAVALVCLCAALCWNQLRYWRHTTTLFRHALAVGPPSAVMHNHLGVALRQGGDADAAMDQFRAALRVYPDFADAHTNLANGLMDAGRVADAIGHYRQALAVWPHLVAAHRNLARALGVQGDFDAAIERYMIALRIEPDDPVLRQDLATALVLAGRVEAGMAMFESAAALQPASPAPLTAAAWLLCTHPDPAARRPTAALRFARRAVALTAHRSPEVLDVLAAAQAAAGRPEEAAATARRALAVARHAGAERLAQAIAARLGGYEPALAAVGAQP